MKRLVHCAHCVLPARYAKGGRATNPHRHQYHGSGATRRCTGLLQLTESQAKNSAAQVTLSLQHTFGKRQELQQAQRSDTVGGVTSSKRSRYAMSRRLWKEQYRDQDGNPLAAPKRTTYLYADEGLIAEASQVITLNADGSVTASAPPVVTTQYGPRPDAPFTTGMLFIMTQNSKGQDALAYYHHDHLGTPIQATDKTGRVVWAADYNAFGLATIITPAATDEAPTIGSNLRLPGQYWDEESGLHYNWHRYYDGATGRYVQSDPIGLIGGINTFAYVGGNPLSAVDPRGLDRIGSVVRLLDNGGKVFTRAVSDISDAVAARLAGESVQMETRQMAKQVEKAAYGEADLLRHKGHDLPGGGTGAPHYQTDGQYGHSFWGKQSGFVDPSILEGFLPLLITPSALAPGTLWGPGTPYPTPQDYDKAKTKPVCL